MSGGLDWWVCTVTGITSHWQRKHFTFCRSTVLLRVSVRGCSSALKHSHACLIICVDDGLCVCVILTACKQECSRYLPMDEERAFF